MARPHSDLANFELSDPLSTSDMKDMDSDDSGSADSELILNIHGNPLELLNIWLQQAKDCPAVIEPTAFTLATVDKDGFPNCRVVLLKGVTNSGLRFFTNYRSRKAQELETGGHRKACINFFWSPLQKQIRIKGHVTRLSPDESDRYFASRSRDSQLGAWASMQSRRLENPLDLMRRFRQARGRFEDQENVPRPPNWGGYELTAEYIEFWHGRPHRLHSRLMCVLRSEEEINADESPTGGETVRKDPEGYKYLPGGEWKFCRLFP